MSMGNDWEDEGYASEDDWGGESVEADLEEEVLDSLELPAELDEELDEPVGE